MTNDLIRVMHLSGLTEHQVNDALTEAYNRYKKIKESLEEHPRIKYLTVMDYGNKYKIEFMQPDPEIGEVTLREFLTKRGIYIYRIVKLEPSNEKREAFMLYITRDSYSERERKRHGLLPSFLF